MGKKAAKRLKKRLTLIEAQLADLEERFQMIAAVLANPGEVQLVAYDTKDSN